MRYMPASAYDQRAQKMLPDTNRVLRGAGVLDLGAPEPIIKNNENNFI
jgi:hypothetical protein